LAIRTGTIGQTTIYKTVHRKLKNKKWEPYENPEMESGGPEG